MMLRKIDLRILLLAVCLATVGALSCRSQRAPDSETRPASETAAITNSPTPLAPGPIDGSIAFVASRMLEQLHFSKHRFDRDVSEKFFDRYLEMLDPQHLHFLQSDLAEFARYRTNLNTLTLASDGVGDTMPAFEIFNRFVERLEQRVAYAGELLKKGKFEFNTNERMVANRHTAPYPRDLNEARVLWRQRLRYEYLLEKLGRTPSGEVASSRTNKLGLAAAPTSRPAQSPAPAKEAKKKTDAEEIADLLTRRYARTLHLYTEWDSEDVLQVYLTALARVYDPHSDYMNKAEAANFAINMNLSLYGIGALLTTDLDNYCKIQELKPGPAMNSKKIKANDRIVAVAQSNQTPVDVVGTSLNKVVQLIRGPKDTEVRLTIIPADDPTQRRVVSLIRAKIQLEDQWTKSKVIEVPDGDGKMLRLGVIDLPSFYTPMDIAGPPDLSDPRFASADVAQFLKKFNDENVSGVILDLRRDGGGSLEEAIKLSGLFIKDGPVVQVKNVDGSVIVSEDRDPHVYYNGPLIVLTSRFSASASEIFAGALQDYGRALIVGDTTTHGKGTVQKLYYLRPYVRPTETATNDPGTLKITMSKFYRATGASTQLKGVSSDIVLPSIWNYSTDIGESNLDNALPWDPIASAKYDKLNLVEPCLDELRERSDERVATNQEFVYVREDIDLFRKNQADKTVSLNERQQVQDKEKAEARQKARNKERRARKESDWIVHDLPLRAVALPGLPPPVEKTNSATFALTFNGTNVTGALPATGTNPVSVAAQHVAPATSPASDPEDEPVPAVDATLDEAEHILVDYISLLSQKGVVTVNH